MIEYRKITKEVMDEYFIYRDTKKPILVHAVDFVAGWNAAMSQQTSPNHSQQIVSQSAKGEEDECK